MSDTPPLPVVQALEPCPFCQGPAITWQRGPEKSWAAGCAVHVGDEPPLPCTVRPFAYGPTEAEAITAWNTRPSQAPLLAQLEEMREALRHLLKVREREGVKPQSRNAAEAKARAVLAKSGGQS